MDENFFKRHLKIALNFKLNVNLQSSARDGAHSFHDVCIRYFKQSRKGGHWVLKEQLGKSAIMYQMYNV